MIVFYVMIEVTVPRVKQEIVPKFDMIPNEEIVLILSFVFVFQNFRFIFVKPHVLYLISFPFKSLIIFVFIYLTLTSGPVFKYSNGISIICIGMESNGMLSNM